MTILKYIATLGFIGYMPFAPGTFGTLAAVFFMVALKPSVLAHIALTVFFIIAGILSSNQTIRLLESNPPHPNPTCTPKSLRLFGDPVPRGERELNNPPPLMGGGEGEGGKKVFSEQKKDPSCIVIDEFTGYMATLLFLPLSWGYIIAAFVLFRFFDILKPPPLRKLEDVFNGGFGIMADDIGAAVYTNLVLQLWRLLN
ncbi:MAG: phosphatidylglycerophosphatase A [Thermodesulfovibrionales bacterium]|nr:phosphatidylglycerophosphatase A [Thermodesulfovibrionales bacterium]